MNINNVELNCIDKKTSIKNDINIVSRSSYYYKKNISVPIVSNAFDPQNNGLCWASVIASKYDYESGNNITAIDVFNALAEEYSDYPIGTLIWISRGFVYYGLSNIYAERMLNCGEILENIKVNNTICMLLSRVGGAHAVLLCGITFLNDESGIYRIMDPNRSVYVDVAVSENTMNGDEAFTYITSYGKTYTDWYGSLY